MPVREAFLIAMSGSTDELPSLRPAFISKQGRLAPASSVGRQGRCIFWEWRIRAAVCAFVATAASGFAASMHDNRPGRRQRVVREPALATRLSNKDSKPPKRRGITNPGDLSLSRADSGRLHLSEWEKQAMHARFEPELQRPFGVLADKSVEFREIAAIEERRFTEPGDAGMP